MHSAQRYLNAAAAALFGAAALAACGAAPALPTAQIMPAITPVAPAAPPLAVLPPAATAAPASPVGEEFAQVSGTGTVRAARTVELSFLPPGRVEQVLVSEGQAVTAGQLLATL
ncbi:MAG: biotin/lipoyl-binding protein, partial [Chloroflexales bacterium]|nr:biotin/lipoyl-binding protein [Chloroflexales bacterium]